jgi:hypothetical protein
MREEKIMKANIELPGRCNGRSLSMTRYEKESKHNSSQIYNT